MRAQGLDFGRFFLPGHENLENKSNTNTSQFVVEILELGQNDVMVVSSVSDTIKRSRLKCHLPTES